jgi:hypothetical protein
MIISGAQVFIMGMLGIFEEDPVYIAVAGGVLAFIQGVVLKIRDSFNFQLISHKHEVSSDSYQKLYYEIGKYLLEEEISVPILEKICEKYVYIERLGHIQNVRALNCCCFAQVSDII